MVASGSPAATASASHNAISSAESAIRTTPVTPISVKARLSLAAIVTGASRSPAIRPAASCNTAAMATLPLAR
jgi:hypothetical protein